MYVLSSPFFLLPHQANAPRKQPGGNRNAQRHERPLVFRIPSYPSPLGKHDAGLRHILIHGITLCPTVYSDLTDSIFHCAVELE